MTLFPTESHAEALRDYQAEARAKTVDAFLEQGFTRVLGVAATGLGKTKIFSELNLEPRLAQWLATFPPSQQKLLVIAHRDELIDQAARRIKKSNPDLVVEVEKAGRRASVHADVVVASVQTLSSGRGKRLRRFDPDRFRVVVCDEAHHSTAPQWLVILQHFGFVPPPDFMLETRPKKRDGRIALLDWQRNRLKEWDALHKPNRLLYGTTATPKRSDKVGLEAVFQTIAFNKDIRFGITNGWLCRVRGLRIQTGTSLDEVKVRAGDFALDDLDKAVNVDPRNAMAVRAYLDYAKDRRATIVFCTTIAHAQAMANAFNLAGVPADIVHGGLSMTERADRFAAFREGCLKVLTNVQVASEGVDIPEIDCVIHARPTKSQLWYTQTTGRGLRICKGKTDCLIIDLVDNTRKHSLITAPELLGLPVGFDAKGGDLLDLKEQVEATQQQFPLADLTDVKDIEDCQLRVQEVDLLGNFHDPVLDSVGQLHWEKTGEGYEISWRGQLLNEFMRVAPGYDGQWKATLLKGPRPYKEWTYPDSHTAIKEAEKWLRKEKPAAWSLNRKDYADAGYPATNDQKRLVAAFGLKLSVDNLTKGEARMLLAHHYAEVRRYK